MARQADAFDELTPREREVLEHLRAGLTDAEIGQRLDISTAGASYHVSEIIGKLGVRNRYEAAAWPDRPPWWASALAPVALLWRKAGAVLPFRLSTAAAVLSAGLFVAALAGIGLVLFLLMRGDGGVPATSLPLLDEIVVPGDFLEGLDGYAFTTELEASSQDPAVVQGDLRLSLDGRFQAPDKVQGTLRLDGEIVEKSGFSLSPEAEIVIEGDLVWWREAGGEWQPGVEPGYETVDPRIEIRKYATPWFYLEALQFDSLTLPVSGPPESVNGVPAYPVRLDKAALVELLPQGNAIKVYPDEPHEHGPVSPGMVENADQVLPRDFLVEVWFPPDGSYPVRIVFDYSIDAEDYGTLGFGFGRLMSLRLQMDITDPDVDVQIEPPLPPPEG